MAALTVKDLIEDKKDDLKLTVAVGPKRALARSIKVSEINRPGLSLSGHTAHFRPERIQIIGQGEYAYLTAAGEKRLNATLDKLMSAKEIPCVIITRGHKVHPAVRKACRRRSVPLFVSALDTATLVGELTDYLEHKLAPTTSVHGVLVNVYGLGVLIQGDPGIGKSECALELVKRDHILVSDDVVVVQQRRGGALVGSCPSTLKHYLEVRGLGIIDVSLLFGIGATTDHSRIELVFYLEHWDEESPNQDRTGLDQKTITILDVPIPMIRMPVKPGRNIAVLIEVAALNQRLRAEGISPGEMMNQRLIETMRGKRRAAGKTR